MRKVSYIILISLLLGMNSCREAPARGNSRYKNHARKITNDYKGKNKSEEKQQALSDTILELPAYATSNDVILLHRKRYVTLYNIKNKIPVWVAWLLNSEQIEGPYKRMGVYLDDLSVPLPRAVEDDYKGVPWTHGHMCPAGDNKWDSIAMRESNLLTNICPQHSSLNSGLWNRIEQDCRQWAKIYGDVYIVCGPVLYNKDHETIGKNKVVVPEAFFKVILRLHPRPAAIGFIVKNNEGKKKKDQYVNTVDEVERITGIDFFPALPDDIENEVEAKTDIGEW